MERYSIRPILKHRNRTYTFPLNRRDWVRCDRFSQESFPEIYGNLYQSLPPLLPPEEEDDLLFFEPIPPVLQPTPMLKLALVLPLSK